MRTQWVITIHVYKKKDVLWIANVLKENDIKAVISSRRVEGVQ